MVTSVELGALAVVLLSLLLLARLVQALRPLLVNTVVGLGIFLLAGVLGVDVAINAFALALVALGGVPGALVVLLLSFLDVAFVPAAVLDPVAALPL